MPHAWIPEHAIDAAAARATIEARYPELSGLSVAPFGEGWDNSAFLIGGEWVFRFPRRAVAVPLIETEARVLPLIAPALPVPVPVPKFTGAPGAPFIGYRKLGGELVVHLARDEAVRRTLARELGGFLRALHAIDPSVAEEAKLGGDTIGRLDVARQLERSRSRFALTGDYSALLDRLANELRDSAPPQLCIVHGDLHDGQMLSDRTGHLTGIIDWGDVHFGDPAVDLAAVHGTLPPSAHEDFEAIYGRPDAATTTRARLRAATHAIARLAYAIDRGDALTRSAAEQSLAWL